MDKRAKVLNELTQIFRTELEDESLVIDYTSSANSVEKWDSINNLIIISAIEEKYGIEFPLDFIFNAENVGDLCDYIVENSSAA